MPRSPINDRLRRADLAQSPIRRIMELADRDNIIAMGLDPDDVISFAGGWVNHMAPEPLRAAYGRIAADAERFHQTGAYSPTIGLPSPRELLVCLLVNDLERMEEGFARVCRYLEISGAKRDIPGSSG